MKLGWVALAALMLLSGCAQKESRSAEGIALSCLSTTADGAEHKFLPGAAAPPLLTLHVRPERAGATVLVAGYDPQSHRLIDPVQLHESLSAGQSCDFRVAVGAVPMLMVAFVPEGTQDASDVAALVGKAGNDWNSPPAHKLYDDLLQWYGELPQGMSQAVPRPTALAAVRSTSASAGNEAEAPQPATRVRKLAAEAPRAMPAPARPWDWAAEAERTSFGGKRHGVIVYALAER